MDNSSSCSDHPRLSFFSQSITQNGLPNGCFVCGRVELVYYVFECFTLSLEEAQKVASLIPTAAVTKPVHNYKWIKLTVGSCYRHLEYLELLKYFWSDGFPDSQKLDDAKHFKPHYVAQSDLYDLVIGNVHEMAYRMKKGIAKKRGVESDAVSVLTYRKFNTLIYDLVSDRNLICQLSQDSFSPEVWLRFPKDYTWAQELELSHLFREAGEKEKIPSGYLPRFTGFEYSHEYVDPFEYKILNLIASFDPVGDEKWPQVKLALCEIFSDGNNVTPPEVTQSCVKVGYLEFNDADKTVRRIKDLTR